MTKYFPTPRIDKARAALFDAGARSLRYNREKNEHEDNGLDTVSFEVFALGGNIVILQGFHPRSEKDSDGFDILKPVNESANIDQTIAAAVEYLTRNQDEVQS
jgi:hypothetical protein